MRPNKSLRLAKKITLDDCLPSKPDLSVVEIRSERVGTSILISASIQNVGIAPTASATPVNLRFDELIGGETLAGAIEDIPPLAPGQIHNLEIEIGDANQVIGNIRKAFLIVDPQSVDSIELNLNPHGDGNTANNFQFLTLTTAEFVLAEQQQCI